MEKVYKIGVYGWLVVLGIALVLIIGVETNVINPNVGAFNSLGYIASIAFLISIVCGLYLWASYIGAVFKHYNEVTIILYICAICLSGYWAHSKARNGQFS
ncbi:MAG: hypothetical protein KZQ73_01170 [Candidatus Thiodiazotropha sp. (ex Semelilucina semeliformis)]|nr:hypothetical protein [Candidatus Thiodiazotropha sp. (ex Semelilucina semeliformis)]